MHALPLDVSDWVLIETPLPSRKVGAVDAFSNTLSRRAVLKLGGLASIHALVGAAGAAAQGGAAQTRVIDVHAHFFPEPFLKSIAGQGGVTGFQVDYSVPGGPMLIGGGAKQLLEASYWDLDQRLQRMDAAGVTLQALSLTMPMPHLAATPERGAELARIVNDAMVEAHTRFPDRFVGCATLPIQDATLAVKELDRLAGSRAIRGAYLPTNVQGRELADPAFFPIYERCQALNLPVLLHPHPVVIGLDRFKQYFLSNLLGNPYDTGVAAANLVFGGVLDRYPQLNIVLPHAGGTLPYLFGRLQHGQEVRPEVKTTAKQPVHEYLRRFYYDTISHSPEALRYLIGLVGADRVVIGSDYTFDMGYERPREVVTQLNLSAADRDKIFFGNAARLLGV